jgi:DNA-binding NarL/FixJ family response regulator
MTAMISDSRGAHGRMTPPHRSADRKVIRGREAEQSVIRDLLRRARRAPGGVVLVDGEPGIGRSLLLLDATDEAAELGFSLAAGAADPLGRAIPFFELRTALREPWLTGRYLPDATAWWVSRIRAHLQQRAAAAPVLVCLDHGVLHDRQGDRDQAIRHLKEALGGYRQVGADRDQTRIRRRLRQLGIRRRHWSTPPARPVCGWDSLTGTEQAVARLVAEGLNNGQVAARMYISTHTVAHHLPQAYRKLTITSRVELARIVIEQAGPINRPGPGNKPAPV